MTDRSELALQLTDAVSAAYTVIQRAGDRAFRAFGLSHRAHAALTAVDRGGGDGARPQEIAGALGVSRAAATTFVQRLEAKGVVETTPALGGDRGGGVTPTPRGPGMVARGGPPGGRGAGPAAPGG